MKLRTGLFVLIGGTLVPVLLLALALGVLLIEHERETFRRGALDRNRAFLSAVDEALRGHVLTLQALAASTSLDNSDLATFRNRAARVLESQPDWQDVLLAAPDGRLLLDVGVYDATTVAADPDVASLQRAVATRAPAIGNVVRRAPGNAYSIAIHYPVTLRGQVAYVLCAIVRPGQFERLIRAQNLPEGWVSGLVDGSARFIARVPRRSNAELASENFRAALGRGTEGWYRGRTIEGLDTFTAHTTSTFSGWSIGLAIPASVVLASAHRTAWTLALGTLVAIALAVAFAFVAGARITSPIAALAAAARAMGRGDPPRAIARESNVGEIRDVARALEEAGTAVAERQASREREEAALKAADRAKDEFIAMLGHELRNPLSAIVTSVRLLREAPPGSGIEVTARDIIERQSRQMTRLVEDLMDISRLTMGKVVLRPEPLDLAQVAEHLVETWRQSKRLAPERVRLTTAPAWVSADRGRIEQVLANLLDNANKFSPPDTPIEVTVRREAGDALVEVADRGDGIAPEMIEQVFRPFVQGPQDLHRPTGGLGLGLSVVQRLTALHGGQVRVESDGRGRGSLFTVRLPAIVAPTEAPPPAASGTPGRVMRVLLVEDDADAREGLEQMLRLRGHETRGAATGREALGVAGQFHPDVVLLDLGLPDIDGFEVARRLRADGAAPPARIVALSGYGQPEAQQRAREAGCDLHLTKPVDPDVLETVLGGGASGTIAPR